MGGFAALLIGASDYERVGFTPLPFVPRDLERLDAALRARGFRVERPGAGERISWNFVNGEVSRFLEKARRGETLLICLSGHGLHAQGVDYLIPEDLHRYRKPLWSGCVAIDWRSEVENTRAAQVLFLVDACREGVGGDTMAGAVGWASGRAMTVKSRRIAHLYACSPGGYAHFVAAGSGSFSLFSRAVLDELLAYDGPLTLEQLSEAVQNRIEVLHTAHGKPGAAQEVRVLTDADQAEFLVAGPLLELAPVQVDDEPPTAEQPLAALDLHELVARAVHQFQTSGRTELLAEYAVLGPTTELLDLAGRLEAAAVTAMWDAAARHRPAAPLLELVGAICKAGRGRVALLLLEAAAVRPAPELPLLLTGLAGLAGLLKETVDALRSTLLRALAALPADAWTACVVELHRAGLAAEAARVSDEPRPVEDLPPLLAALEAEELPTEVRRLVRATVARLGSRSVDGFLLVLSRAGAGEARAAALAAMAEWSAEAVGSWLRSTGGRGGLERDATAVVRILLAEGRDVRSLPGLLREAGMSRYLDVFHEECARQEPRALRRLLDHLSDGDVHESDRPGEDAVAVVRLAAGLMVPKEAGELAVLLCGHGPDNLLAPFLQVLCGAPPERAAHFLVRVWELPTEGRTDRDPVAAAVSALGGGYPAEGVGALLAALEQRRLSVVAARLRDALVRDRSTVDLLTVLARTPSAARDVLVGRIRALRRDPGRLAELLDACGEERFASLGDPLARAVVAEYGPAELTALRAELRARNGQAGERLLRDRLGPDPSAAVPVPLPAPSTEPAPASRERSGPGDAAALVPVLGNGSAPSEPVPASELVPVPAPELAVRVPSPGRPPVDPAVDLPLPQLLDLLAAPARSGGPTAGPSAAQVRDVLLRAARLRPPDEVAELVLALDGPGPGFGAAVDLTELLGAALAAGPVERTGALIEALGHRYPAARPPGERLVEAVRVHAARLFAAARASGSAPGTSYLLGVFPAGPPVAVAEFRALLAELRRTGSAQEAATLLGRLGHSQPPPVVVGLLEALRDDEAFEVLCRAAAGRPVREVAEVLANFRLERPRKGQAIQRFVEHLARSTALDRFAELLVELLAGRQGVFAGALLGAARWTGSEEEIGRLFTALDARGEEVRGVAMDTLAPELSAPQADGILAHLRRHGAEQVGLPVLRVHARRSDIAAFWAELNERGWFRYAAVLVDEAPPDAPVVAWYRQLHRTAPELHRAHLLWAAGADGPVGELADRAARGGPTRAALAAAVLYREPEDVVALLAALADLPLLPTRRGTAFRPVAADRRAELWQILAAARPPAELALVLRALRANGRLSEAERIVDHLLADEHSDRVAALLEAPLPVDGPTDRGPAGHSNEMAELLAGRVLAGGSVAGVIGGLLRIGRSGSAKMLATAFSSRGRSGAEIARAVVSLVEADLPAELSRAMTVSVCRYRPPEDIAEFLQYLDPVDHGTALQEAITTASSRRSDEVAELRRQLEQQGYRELAARLPGPEEPRTPGTWWRPHRRH
ncbi:caspase family protein [Kitasatospora purpeofusca]|uniref:caspase family protein n=1 Tax=Kitasatospora purpeofusca TaxID=67352 RepID=UPI0022566A93|nr:caspase family protein [Kitasatospora purpeofusca]MCX4759243.1 caspase family protein [Kitasatospora purpeofusca]WSR30358.1 caspase family protein [Kitasatospora purpeofusca]